MFLDCPAQDAKNLHFVAHYTMTKQNTTGIPGTATADSARADAPVPTPAMICAGVAVLNSFVPEDAWMGAPEEVVDQIWRAMNRAAKAA
jgi:hypothetical protein